MAHVRTQIRNAVAAQLGGLPATGAHVYVNRLRPLQASELPALIVRTDDESVNAASIHWPALLDRRLTLVVECVVQSSAAIDSTLDNVIEQVESAMSASAASTQIGGLAQTSRLSGVQIEIDADGEIPVARALLRYEINYFTPENQPDVAS